MPKRIFITGGIFLLFSFYTLTAYGQCWRVIYCKGCVANGLCPEYQDFNSKTEAETSAKINCPGEDPRVIQIGNCGQPGPVHKLQFTSPLGNGIMGAMLGGLGFSLLNDKNGKNQWAMGAAGGYFFFSSLTFIAQPKSRPMGTSIFLGVLNGAAGGYAAGQAIQYFKVQNSTPTEPAKEDKITLPATVVTAALGGITGAVTFKHKGTKGGGTSFHIRKSKLFTNTAFVMSGNRIGVIVKL